MVFTLQEFRRRIEYSICQHFADDENVRALCRRAREAGVGVACFNPVNIPLAVDELRGSGIEISANIGFPFGSHYPEVKALETERAVREGANQIDVVVNVGAIRSGCDDTVLEEIRAVVDAAGGRLVKTIIETWVLTDGQIERACRIAEKAGTHIVKTSTGVRTQYLEMLHKDARGADVEVVKLMRRILGPSMRIKASGGIYTLDDALQLIRAGADQLGMSKAEEVIVEFEQRFGDLLEL